MIKNCESLLVVDDDPENLWMLENILSQQGYKVRTALSGTDALKTIGIEAPDLILLDILMPEMNGYAVCSALKAAAETCEISVIFLSVIDNVSAKIKAFAIGGADYITKPFYVEEVLARVRQQLTIQEQTRRLQQEIAERKQVEADLRAANQELERVAYSDALTEIANRRYFDQIFQHEWQRSRREQQPLSLILYDIDYFKAYNDRYGHVVGDACLKQIAQATRQRVRRPTDLIARYGGEEFAVILPNTCTAGAACMAAHLQSAIAALQIPHADFAISPVVTVSIGIACLIPGLNDVPESLIAAADQAMYAAKAKGRNTSCTIDLIAPISPTVDWMQARQMSSSCQLSNSIDRRQRNDGYRAT